MSKVIKDGPYVLYHRQRTATGLRNRYRSRTTYDQFWAWMREQPTVVDPAEDWPWAYWSFDTPESEAAYAEEWGDPVHCPDEDDTMDTPVPVVRKPWDYHPSESLECIIFDALQEEIQAEINREIIVEIQAHAKSKYKGRNRKNNAA